MNKYGWWNVRGGSYCQVNMTTPPKQIMLELPNQIKKTTLKNNKTKIDKRIKRNKFFKITNGYIIQLKTMVSIWKDTHIKFMSYRWRQKNNFVYKGRHVESVYSTVDSAYIAYYLTETKIYGRKM